jgi:hypothetical protein
MAMPTLAAGKTAAPLEAYKLFKTVLGATITLLKFKKG